MGESRLSQLHVAEEIAPGVLLDSRLALWLERSSTLVVADIHWGYALEHRRRGSLMPAWGDCAIRCRLLGLLHTYRPARMIWLGDSLHGPAGRTPAEEFMAQVDVEIFVLQGNHDRGWSLASHETLQLDSYFFHHGDVAHEVPDGCTEVIGHWHPAYTWQDGAGGRVKLPAFIQGRQRWILPAFSPWAGGNTAGTLAGREDGCRWLVSPRRIFPLRPGWERRTGLLATPLHQDAACLKAE